MDARWTSSRVQSIEKTRAASFGCATGASSTWPMARHGRYIWCDPVPAPLGDAYSLMCPVWWPTAQKKCTLKHPPGRKVYQRGAHTIWEVDGSKEKVSKYRYETAAFFHTESSYIARISRYLESCSLTSRPCFSTAIIVSVQLESVSRSTYIWVVLFYIFTDADSQRDHVLGFFSKVNNLLIGSGLNLTRWQEKISYDDYNLACIVVLPPYQKKGYGMLLIEFSTR